jgi:NADH-quinone oxidoreductase subunit J
LAIVLALILLFETGYLAVTRWGGLGMLNQVEAGFGDPQTIGLTLFSQYLLPFEVVSVLLLVAMIGVIVLSRRQERKG